MNLLEIILVIVGFLAIYNFIVYPVLLEILKIIRPKIILPDSDFEPAVCLVKLTLRDLDLELIN